MNKSPIEDREERLEKIRNEMGGKEKLQAMKASGDRTIREHIEVREKTAIK